MSIIAYNTKLQLWRAKLVQEGKIKVIRESAIALTE
jgi:hypothetical protein